MGSAKLISEKVEFSNTLETPPHRFLLKIVQGVFYPYQEKYTPSSENLTPLWGEIYTPIKIKYTLLPWDMYTRMCLTSSQAPRCTSWKAEKLTGWQIDKMTNWQAAQMTRWQEDRMTRRDDKMSWQDEMTGWHCGKSCRCEPKFAKRCKRLKKLQELLKDTKNCEI